jgi:hypothetical protein
MTSMPASRRFICGMALLSTVGWVTPARAQLSAGSTWVRTDAEGKGITMTVEPCCNGGLRLVYQMPPMGKLPATSMTVDSPMNGAEVPALVGGKPSGETMAITRVDSRHYHAVIKLNGQPYGTSTATLTADGKAMTVESVTQAGGQTMKVIETWVRK